MESTVRRNSRSFVRPAAPTPSGSLELSSIDRDVGLRHIVRSLHVFRPRHTHVDDKHQSSSSPARVVRDALGKALVDYYPLAGRIVDGPEGRSTARMELTGDGAWFVTAAASCTLDDVAGLDHHPFAIPAQDLLPDFALPPNVQPLDVPVMMQVTEFACGGFVVGLSSSHTLTDGLGAGQFINAVADYARGLPNPRVGPIWGRGDLVPDPPKKKVHSGPPPSKTSFQFQYLVVDLSVESIDTAKSRFMESTGRRCSSFDVAVAKVWQARTRALRLPDTSARVTLCFFANSRHVLQRPEDEAVGFYGNCFYPATVEAMAGEVEVADVATVVGMVMDAKARLHEEVARWAAGELVAGEEDPYDLWWRDEPLFVSDWRQLGFMEADYGWGTPSHVAPLAAIPFMPVALIVAPPTPRTGVRLMTQCVEEQHMAAFTEEMKAAQE
ncbi:hypothetical protein HU200_056812 [Digitaria exilis]|uniref:Uncharacterized protein n=1 Tax=Digitaria exilis TaxID=1010633 RepID=A0A835E253_9POAL|nr:hypothetical protein HU200_056812 [Digitaria exilis]